MNQRSRLVALLPVCHHAHDRHGELNELWQRIEETCDTERISAADSDNDISRSEGGIGRC